MLMGGNYTTYSPSIIIELFLALNSIISMCSKLFLGSKAQPEAKTGIQ